MKSSTLSLLACGGALAASFAASCTGSVSIPGTGGATAAHASSNGSGVPPSTGSDTTAGSTGGAPFSTGADTTAGSTVTSSSTGGAPPSTGSDTTAGSTTSTSTGTGSAGGPSSTTTSGVGSGSSSGGPVLCTAAQQGATWLKMDLAPVEPPDHAALLGLLGLTQPAAEQILCQGMMLGDMFGDGSAVEAWGQNQEVWLDYTPGTLAAVVLTLWPGYVGTVDFKSPGGTSSYQLALNTQVTKNGQPFQLDWSNMALFGVEVDELNRGIMSTFTNEALDPPGTTCVTSGSCAIGTFGDAGFVYFKTVGFSIWVASVSAPQPVQSTPNRFDMFPL